MGQMGHLKVIPEGNTNDNSTSLETIQRYINELFKMDQKQSTLESIMPSILIISRFISEQHPFSNRQDCFYVNPALLRCFYHPSFQNTIEWMVGLLSKQLKQIMDSRFIMLVSRQKFRKCLNLAKFCLFFLDQTLIQTINLLSVKPNVHIQSLNILDQFAKQKRQPPTICLFKTLASEKTSILSKIFLAAMEMMINLHLNIISRSDFTMKSIDELNYSVFILFCKLYFSGNQEARKLDSIEHCKILIKIGAYFIGTGFQHNIPSLYQSAVLLLLSVIQQCDQDQKQTKALPSHLFKSLPIVNNNEMIEWLICILIFSLKYIKEGSSYNSRLNTNRILPFKLLELIIQKMKPIGQQITFMLEELCLQTKLELIERIYLSSIAQKYSKLIDNTSQMIKEYIQAKKINFKVNLNNQKLSIKSSEVLTELQKGKENLEKQMIKVHAKYVQQVIFRRKELTYDYSDKALWNSVLINLKGQQHPSPKLQKEEKQYTEDIIYFQQG